MRVLAMVSRDPENPFCGGGERVLWEFSRALAQSGHEVSYLCSTYPSSERETWIDGVHLFRLSSNTLLGPAAFLAYRRSFRARNDLLLEDVLGGSKIPFFAPLYVGEPVVGIWLQDHIPLFRNQYPSVLLPALMGLERMLVFTHRNSHMLVPSVAARDDLIKKGGNPGQIQVFHPGISRELLEGDDPPPARDRVHRILCLGKIRRYKCVHHAILALGRISKGLPEAKLCIAGRMGDRAYLRELRILVRELGLEQKVEIELNVSEARKADLLRTSRVLVAPAPIEGFGIAVVEASACGLPVVGTLGVPDDSLREEVNGFKVPFGDVEAMADKMAQLLSDDTLFDSLSQRARLFAQGFTWQAAVQPFLRLVAQIESQPPR